MRVLTDIRWGLVARFAWVYLTVGILLLGFGTFLVEPVGVVPLRDLMPLMIFVSFPAGSVAFLLAFPLDITPGIDFFLLWLITFLAGYIQWFYIVPKFRRSGHIMTLSLCQPICTPTISVDEPQAVKEPSQPKHRIKRAHQFRILHYDAAGRTPLERAIFFRPQKRTIRPQ